MSEVLLALLRMNLAAAAAIGLILLLRRPIRRLLGARVAYGLWSLAPFAAAATLLPARIVTIYQPALPAAGRVVASPPDAAAVASAPAPAIDLQTILVGVWAAGALGALAWLIWRQVQFAQAVRAGHAGPAVVGVFRPRIVTPGDFATRYTEREQQVVLAHERTHIVRQDPRINAAVALARCANWFNPLAHLLVHYLRIDQELACDAQVVAAHPAARRAYAEALLKTQLAARPLPLGCYWPAQSAHPLAERIALLSRSPPGPTARALGVILVALLALGGGWTARAARPAEVHVVVAPPGPPAVPTPATSTAPTPNPRLTFARPAVGQTPPPESPSDPAAMAEPRAEALPVAEISDNATEPPEGCGEDATPAGGPRLLPPGFFGPSRKVRAIAGWSSVEPGSAVRVYATMTDPDGIPLTTDLTAFGSQSWYRLGCIRRGPSHYRLFTRVVQRGDQLFVTAGLNQSFKPMISGSLELPSGGSGVITLPNGLQVVVTATLRPETPVEIDEGRRTAAGRLFVSVLRVPTDA